MKKLIAAIVLASTLSLAGCQSSTSYGQCLGVGDDDMKDPALVYRPSVRNIILGVLFMEMIFPPIIVLVSEFQCPVSKK